MCVIFNNHTIKMPLSQHFPKNPQLTNRQDSGKINLNENRKAGHTMNDKQPHDCELCAYYAYDEDYEEYCCEVSMDEDDYVKYITGGKRNCPFFRFGDEYKIAAKQ